MNFKTGYVLIENDNDDGDERASVVCCTFGLNYALDRDCCTKEC